MKRAAAVLFSVAVAGCSGGLGSSSSNLEGPDPGQCGVIEMHVFGIHDAPDGQATVEIDRPGKHVVVVSAHDAVNWKITTGPGAELVHVYAVGVHEQTVDASAAAGEFDVKTDSKDTTGVQGCGFTWPYDGVPGCNTRDLLRLASVRTGHDANSFDGCHSTSGWVLDDRMHSISDCYESFDGNLVNHFIAECDGGNEGHCGNGSDTGSNGSDTSGDGGPVFY